MGAAGRDFHNFNVYFRHNPQYEVVAFTATQIPNISGRKYPVELAGKFYPNGIPIYPESELVNLIRTHKIDLVVFAYSDVPHSHVMHCASISLAGGADFKLLGPRSTMLKSTKPLIAIGAVRTGCGKSPTTRKVAQILQQMGKKVSIIRHPMPYSGDIISQEVQRFATYSDLSPCTIEEREEYEPHIEMGNIVYAGVDYEKILRSTESEGDVILWDGGNNDLPFYASDLFIVIVDPLRAGDELLYYPGETCLRMADVVIINKMDSATQQEIELVKKNTQMVNPTAQVIEANSSIKLATPDNIKNKSVLIVEDGPTVTHGGMGYGAGFVIANRVGVKSIIDPRAFAVGSIAEVYKKYPSVSKVLPAMGYSLEQIEALEKTINNTPADIVIIATPIDLRKLIKINKQSTRVAYELEEISKPDLKDILQTHSALNK